MRLLENDIYHNLQSGNNVLIYYLEADMSGSRGTAGLGAQAPPPSHPHTFEKYIKEN